MNQFQTREAVLVFVAHREGVGVGDTVVKPWDFRAKRKLNYTNPAKTKNSNWITILKTMYHMFTASVRRK